MKYLYINIMLCGLILPAFYSCHKDSDNTDPGALSGNKLNGKISDWTLGSNKVIYAYVTAPGYKVGQTTIAADGSFTLVLDTPNVTSMNPVYREFDNRLTFSDTLSLCATLDFLVLDTTGSFYGYLDRLSSTLEYQEGFVSVDYMYVTRNTSVKGSFSYSDMTQTRNGSYYLNLKTGWNAVVTEIQTITGEQNNWIIDYTVTNNETSTTKWLFFPGKKKSGLTY
jgi:hypothetical protein